MAVARAQGDIFKLLLKYSIYSDMKWTKVTHPYIWKDGTGIFTWLNSKIKKMLDY